VGPSIQVRVGPTMDNSIGRVQTTERGGRDGIPQTSRHNGAGIMSPPSTVLQHEDVARQLTLRDLNLACE
jgi:hypothetical protein